MREIQIGVLMCKDWVIITVEQIHVTQTVCLRISMEVIQVSTVGLLEYQTGILDLDVLAHQQILEIYYTVVKKKMESYTQLQLKIVVPILTLVNK